MRIIVDRSTCRGYANCVVESPDFFDIDDTGKVIALTDSPDSGRFDEVRRATASCPVRAIGLQE